jgi:N-acetylmuramoyl-L-alanine amidase
MLLILGPVVVALCAQWDREAAKRAWEEATSLRASLSQTSEPSRESYLKCIRTFRQVYLKDPHFHACDDAVYEAAKLYQEMGERFGNLSYFQNAAKLYRFLTTDYARSTFIPDTLLRLGTLNQGPLADEKAAQEAFEKLRTRYKSSQAAASLASRAKGAPATPAPLSMRAPATQAATPIPPPPAPTTPASAQRKAVGPVLVKNILLSSGKDFLRVSIVSDGEVKYTKSHLSNPDRVFFDIAGSRLERSLVNKSFAANDRFLKTVRVGQNRSDVVRVVLDLNSPGDFTIADLGEAFGICVEIREKGAVVPQSVQMPKAGVQPLPPPVKSLQTPAAKAADPEAPKPKLEQRLAVNPPNPSAARDASARGVRDEAVVAAPAKPKTESVALEVKPIPPPAPAKPADIKSGSTQPVPPKTEPPAELKSAAYKPPVGSKSEKDALPDTVVANKENAGRASIAAPKEAPKASIPPVPVVTEPLPLPKTPLPTSKGDRTMTRILGLKIGRIVLDPGHGGHDTGSVGQGGMMEKDLVLQLAKELKKLLQEKLGAEVILTRRDDTFISLEERTAIANEHDADLFISIHANSSIHQNVSGVETYFLDFARSDAAREVAARENATTDHNMRDLQNLIQKIAQADKMAESRELASIVQKNLYRGARKMLPSSQNRGVRSAPFIVLIGARMPSVLAEVAFISNPKDEKQLKREVSQQSLANALFLGIEGYMKTLGLGVAQNRGSFK